MTAIRQNIPLTETFTAPNLAGYSTYQASSNASSMGRTPQAPYNYGLTTQKHIDIRTFNASQTTIQNLVPDPSFEYDTVGQTPATYSANGTLSTLQVQGGWAALGSKSLRVTMPTTSGAYTVPGALSAFIPVTAGQVLTVGAVANVLSLTGTAAAIVGLDVPGTGIQGYITSAATGVQTLTQTYTVPAGVTQVQVFVGFDTDANGSNNAAGDGYFDKIFLSTGAAYFDGDMLGYQWLGTQGNSVSQNYPGFFANPEKWSSSSTNGFAVGGIFNNQMGLEASLSTGTTTFTSIAGSLDLTQVPSGNITLALPNFPLSAISTSGSSVALSDGTHTSTLTFASSTTPIANGNTTATWPISSVTGINLAAVTKVQIIINATGATTFNAMALRLVGPNWIVSNVDFDTWNGMLRQPVALNGTTNLTPTNQQLPIIWRAASTPGVDDPRPINGEFGILFYTGSQTQQNFFTLYMREETQAYLTQLDLEGSTQAALTGQPQPTEGVSEYSPRTISDLEQSNMGQLDSKTMIDLERMENPVYQSWVSFTLQWGSNTLVQIDNSSNQTSGFPGYQYTPTNLANNTLYLMTCNLTDNTARMQIWSLNQSTLAMIAPVFDTTVIPDSSMFPRQAGRVGWTASFLDGDTYVKEIRPRNLMFAEYKSKPFQSLTPVSGARLYAQFTPDTDLFSKWSANGDTNGNVPTISLDQSRFVSTDSDQQSTKVTVTNPSPAGITPQSIISNWLSPPGDMISGITSFDQLSLDLSVWIPSNAFVQVPSENLIPNPSFEHDAINSTPAGWTNSGQVGVFQVQTGWSANGTQSLRVTSPSMTASQFDQALVISQETYYGVLNSYQVAPGQQISVSAIANVLAVTGSASLATWMSWYDVSGTLLSTSYSAVQPNSTGIFTLSDTFNAPYNAAVVTIRFVISSGASGGSMDYYLDEIQATYGPPSPIFITGDRLDCSWLGTPGNSTSLYSGNKILPPIYAYLISSQNNSIPITLPTITPDQWSTISLTRPVLPPYPLSGLYQLALYYNGTTPTTFWVDAVHVKEPSVKWDARSVTSDPWNANTAPWTPFHDKVNSDVDGIKFTTLGATTQVRGQALRQDAAILSNPTLVPQYAQLGRLVWPEDAPTLPTLPTPNFAVSNSGRTFTFTPATGPGNFYWSFGDGTYGTGSIVSHTYASYLSTGTQFTVTLTYVNYLGQAVSALPYLVTLP